MELKQKLDLLPEKSGCYMMKNNNEEVIYVGKAKSLRQRVRSYFTGSHNEKTQKLVSNITDFEYIVTASNTEALILECNLIKKHQPIYNVLLKDDKTYPYIKITNDQHPRLEIVRKVLKDKAQYYGPYVGANAARETKKLLDRMYKLRKCKNYKKEPCLYYHIGQCYAPCTKGVNIEIYRQDISEINKFLKGDFKTIKDQIKAKMLKASEQLDFERAKEYRDQIAAIDIIMEKQKINLPDKVDRDIFGYYTKNEWMCVQILHMRQGKLIERDAKLFRHYGDGIADFASFVTQYYYKLNGIMPMEIILPVYEDSKELSEWLNVKVRVPERGALKKLVNMAIENAKVAVEERFLFLEKDFNKTWRALEELAELLDISVPRRIEAFDNSNIQGTDPVSAMVVYTDGKPDRKEYRKYKIKSVEGADDYATMREVIRRRYLRVLEEKLPPPDLIVIDGGIGHINTVQEVLINELSLNIPVCGLKKNKEHKTDELIFGLNPRIIAIDKASSAFYLLQRIQEEVHRFAITYHRAVKSKQTITSVLDKISGVGPSRRKMLLKHFGSIKKISEASLIELQNAGVPLTVAKNIKDSFSS